MPFSRGRNPRSTRSQSRSTPSKLATTRRQLLQGAGGAGIVSLLVPTIGWAEASTKGQQNAASTASSGAMLWIGFQQGESLSLTAMDPTGALLVTNLSVPLVTTRSPDGSQLVSLDLADGNSGSAHQITLRSANEGTIAGLIAGSSSAVSSASNVSGHELRLSLSADARYAAALDTAWMVNGNREVTRTGPSGDVQQFTVPDVSSLSGVEVFDLSAMTSVGSAALGSSSPATSCGFAGDVVAAWWTDFGLGGQRHAVAQAVQSMGTQPMQPISSEALTGLPGGAAISTPGGLWIEIVDQNTLQVVAPTGQVDTVVVFPVDWGTAKPFPTGLFTFNDAVVVVNPGVPAAAVVDAASGNVQAVTKLASQQGVARGLLSSWSMDVSADKLYVADNSGNQGGIWVYELPSLQLADRWLSSTAFAAVRCSPDGNTIYAIGQDAPLAFVLTSDGAVASATELTAQPSELL